LTAVIRSAVPGWVARKPPLLLPPDVLMSQLSVSAICCLPLYPARLQELDTVLVGGVFLVARVLAQEELAGDRP